MANNQARSVLIFSTAYFPLVGGAEVAIEKIAQRLPNWQFDLITAKIRSGLAGFEKMDNINVYRTGFGLGALDKFLLPIFGVFKAKKLDKKKRYSIIWSIMASQAGVAAVFFKFFSQGKKLLLTIQEGDPEEYLKRYVFGVEILYQLLVKPWHLLPFKNADYITVISADLKKRALKNKVKAPIEIVPNAVDLEVFKPRGNIISFSPDLFKKELGIELGKEKTVLTVSRLVIKNGIDDLIKSGKYLDFPFKIFIIGAGSEEKNLKKLSEELNLGNKTRFLGYIPHNELFKYYYIADVFVRPSLSEGLGNVFLEAMAAGAPIIGTPVGGIPDFLIDGETGLFCQVGNPKSIALKIKEILSNDELRRRIIKNGQKLVQDKYNWDNIALKMEDIFQNMI